jgi:hypothetical protein
MKRGIDGGEFVEWAEVHGNYYGTRCVVGDCTFLYALLFVDLCFICDSSMWFG